MRQIVVEKLRPFDAVAIENGVGIGTPDVNCRYGWIELKSVDMPRRSKSIVRVEHFTQEQRVWLMRRWRCGGMAALLLKVGDWWLLFDGQTAFETVGKVCFSVLVDNCYNGWQGTPQTENFRDTIEDLYWRKAAPARRTDA